MKNIKKTTLGDRFAASFALLLASFVTALLIWGIVFLFIGRAGQLFMFPFSFVFYSTVFFTTIGFILPDTSIELIGWVWKKLEPLVKLLINNR